MKTPEDWKDKPAGYWADPKVKARRDKWEQEEREFARLVEIELGKMGYERHEIPTDSDIERADKIARRKLGIEE